MKTRIITAAVLLAIFIPILIFFDTVFYPIALAILAGVGVFELLRCIGVLRDLWISLPSIAFAATLTLLGHFFASPYTGFAYFAAVAFCYLFYLFALIIARRGDLTFSTVAQVFCGGFLIGASFLSLGLLARIPGGGYWYLLPYIGAWVTDTFAYFTGRFFGKHKLIPQISPKKTVEGSIGGIAFCIGGFLLYGLLVGRSGANPNYLMLAVAGLFVSVLSQVGDLTMSQIKREYGRKDYSNLFPGHGGVLDRFDSVIAVAPFLLLLYLMDGVFRLF